MTTRRKTPYVHNRGDGLDRFRSASAVPDGLGATGVILADQFKSLDWKQRRTDFAATLPRGILNEVLDKVLALIDPEEQT